MTLLGSVKKKLHQQGELCHRDMEETFQTMFDEDVFQNTVL